MSHDAVCAVKATTSPLSAVFMGTPAFAAAILQRLLTFDGIRITAVYTQPDKPAGRGKTMKAPEVKMLALEQGLPVHQPRNFKLNEDVEILAAYKPDVLLVAAYGLLLPQRVLDIPKCMPINVHASLLPKYRGAAPIQRSVMHGDSVTGVTIMRMEAGLDTGAILLQRAVGIDINDTAATLHVELAEEGAELLVTALERLAAGTLHAIEQDESRATHAAKLTKAEGHVNFDLTGQVLHAQIRGLTPWPGAFTTIRRQATGETVLPDVSVVFSPGIFPLTPAMQKFAEERQDKANGTVLGVVEDALLIRCAGGCYAFSQVRPAGKNAMSGRAFYNGYLANTPNALCG